MTVAISRPVEEIAAYLRTCAELADAKVNEYKDLRLRHFPSIIVYWDAVRFNRDRDVTYLDFTVAVSVNHPDFATAMDELMDLTAKTVACLERLHDHVTWSQNVAIEVERVDTDVIFSFSGAQSKEMKPIAHVANISLLVVEQRPPGTY